MYDHNLEITVDRGCGSSFILNMFGFMFLVVTLLFLCNNTGRPRWLVDCCVGTVSFFVSGPIMHSFF